MDELHELLMDIKETPAIYLGKPSLKRLKTFIDGYIVCRNQICGKNSLEFYPGFQEFIIRKFDIKISTHWAKVIDFICFTDEQSFYKFFELLDVFLEKN